MTSPSDTYPLTFLTDRTTIETDWQCGMKRWWYKHENGSGMVPTKEAVYFKQGRDIHEDFAVLATEKGDLEEFARAEISRLLEEAGPSLSQVDMEVLTRRCGWIAANALFVEPTTREVFETIDVESEIVLDRDPLWVATTPDRILRRYEGNGSFVVRDYKSTTNAGYGWQAHWDYAAQLQILIAAVQEEYGAEVEYAQIMGLSKGQDRDGRLRHPYVWAFVEKDGEWTPHYKYGLTSVPVWEYPDGILEWVKKLGPEVAAGVFPFSKPVFLNERLLNTIILSRMKREREVEVVVEACQEDTGLRSEWFEPRYSQCKPVIGSPCPYLAACHNETVNANPLGSGLYEVRIPHHEMEIIAGGDES